MSFPEHFQNDVEHQASDTKAALKGSDLLFQFLSQHFPVVKT